MRKANNLDSIFIYIQPLPDRVCTAPRVTREDYYYPVRENGIEIDRQPFSPCSWFERGRMDRLVDCFTSAEWNSYFRSIASSRVFGEDDEGLCVGWIMDGNMHLFLYLYLEILFKLLLFFFYLEIFLEFFIYFFI